MSKDTPILVHTSTCTNKLYIYIYLIFVKPIKLKEDTAKQIMFAVNLCSWCIYANIANTQFAASIKS